MPSALRIARFQTLMVVFDTLFGRCVGCSIGTASGATVNPERITIRCSSLSMASGIARKGIAHPIGPASALMLEQFKLIRSSGVRVLQDDTAH
jgi:hypothetical protein